MSGGIRAPHLVKVAESTSGRGVAEDRNFTRLKDYLREQMDRAPWLDGRLVEGQSLTALGTTQVQHKLGRAYRGWWVCGGSLNGDYPGEGTSDDETKFLALTVTSSQTVDIWVY